MITRPVARWIAFGICLTIMIASFFMTFALSKPVVNDPVVGQDESLTKSVTLNP
jgi:hypothetical protein